MLNRPDVEDKWLYERCREVQKEPDNHLDLWAREHYKSTIITFAKTIQDILAGHGDDPLPEWGGREPTFGIFSFNRPNAKKFLEQIRTELANNQVLKELFPDVLYQEPERDAPKWSLDEGITVKRKTNPKEQTVEAWGLVDSMPTGAHFLVRIYDDVITEKFARSPDMIKKATESWGLSLNLGARGGRQRYIGTRYHFNDTYREILKRKTAIPRIYPATEDGTVEGEPRFLTREELAKKRQDMGPYVYACQMLQNPTADETQGFKRDWVKFHHGSDGTGMNIYIVVDPASEKKKTSDYSVFEVIGLGQDHNYYTLDLIRDRLSLTQRADMLFRLHKKWRPLGVGYEKYGMQADIEHIKDKMERENYRFTITPLGGNMPKNDRIKRLVPIFEQGRWYLPESRFYTKYDGTTSDLVDEFLTEEYDTFPVPVHDDMFDAKARILEEDLNTQWPLTIEQEDRYSAGRRRNRGSSWSA